MKLFKNSLYIVSTPIGNLDDITIRALDVLKKSDIILCEDTRHSLKLLNHFKIKKKLISYHKFNEKKQMASLLEHIKQGKILSLISDAGTPLLSDPGQILLNECISLGIRIVPVPGVSSITAAVSASGFNDQFLFFGFLPKKENQLEKILSSLSDLNYTQVFFIPSIKINLYIKKFKKYFYNRQILIARELTKIHEQFYRGEVYNFDTFKNPLKGELTVVISGIKSKVQSIDKEKIINKAKKYLKKYSLKDTVELISETENANKKNIYQLCLELKNEKNN